MPAGIRQRHRTSCKRKRGCQCPFEAFVFSVADSRKVRKGFPTLAAAKAWRADTMATATRDTLRAPTTTTVREAAEAFLAGASDGSIPTASGGRYKPATLRGYRVGLNKRVLPALGPKRLSAVHRRDVQDLADRLTAEGLSASTVQNTLDPLRVIYRRAIRREEVVIDPTKGLELRRKDGRRERIADPAEAAALIAALPDSERALWTTAFYAGLRRGELRALRWSHVDLEARVIHVRRGWDNIEGEQDVKTAAGRRRVPIIDALAGELTAHKERTGRDGAGLVFGATATQPFPLETVRRRSLTAWGWEEIPNPDDDGPRDVWVRGDGALDPITLHDARHTCASILIAAGVNPKALSVIMGHSTIAITFDTYGHLMPAGLDEAAAATNAYLADLARPPLKLAA
jgi:integrase